tara:strand:- start:24 stop:725 length:702 start_codon:yes stop_codon:yes gene_type:complete
MNEKFQILLPVYNEASSIRKTLFDIYEALKDEINFEFIITEDGSTDNTKEILNDLKKQLPMTLISDDKRKYYSLAVLDGIKKASSDFLLIMDSDGQCDPKDIMSFWHRRKESDLVCGYRSPRYDFAYRRFISKIFYLIYNVLFKVPLRDPSFAFVFMNKKTYKNLSDFTPYLPDGFFWEFNARANKLNFLFSEIKINHRKRSAGDTKIYTLNKLPRIAYNNLLGLFKLKKEIG